MFSKGSKNKIEELKSLLPLYLNKSLENSKKEDIERAIKENMEIQKEIAEWEKIKEAYELIAAEIPKPSERVYSQIVRNIKNNKEKTGIFLHLLQLLRTPGFSFAIIVFQFFVILFLLFHIWLSKEEYHTLSTPLFINKNNIVKVKVIFKEEAKEKEIRNLLLSTDAKIIYGPSPSGLYVISINKNKVSKTLKIFKNSHIVDFVEKAY
ncbi:MAG: hypothetical protein OD816_001380 [Thermodesulfobacterium sp.]|uniref:Uncharacterized protein n=1 Tax=Candidatus Thermodesulfobacterium syntrophicum TaxID=3060442 RepID=A0AAE3P5E5_9BACT|nr:hypothetical protein [Candidatus Thermodesulfobacterium syntrophicum]